MEAAAPSRGWAHRETLRKAIKAPYPTTMTVTLHWPWLPMPQRLAVEMPRKTQAARTVIQNSRWLKAISLQKPTGAGQTSAVGATHSPNSKPKTSPGPGRAQLPAGREHTSSCCQLTSHQARDTRPLCVGVCGPALRRLLGLSLLVSRPKSA